MRPQRAKKVPKPAVLTLRLSEAEMEQVKAVAAFKGLTVSEWTRGCIGRELSRPMVNLTVQGVKVW